MRGQSLDYHTHILIGLLASGTMKVIWHWPHVPRQAEVQQEIDTVNEPCVAFALCAPTSIVPMADKTGPSQRRTPR